MILGRGGEMTGGGLMFGRDRWTVTDEAARFAAAAASSNIRSLSLLLMSGVVAGEFNSPVAGSLMLA